MEPRVARVPFVGLKVFVKDGGPILFTELHELIKMILHDNIPDQPVDLSLQSAVDRIGTVPVPKLTVDVLIIIELDDHFLEYQRRYGYHLFPD